MNKFVKFLESLKSDTNTALIESIKEGYSVCFESANVSEYETRVTKNTLTQDGGEVDVTIKPKKIGWFNKSPEAAHIIIDTYYDKYGKEAILTPVDILKDTYFIVKSDIKTYLDKNDDMNGDWDDVYEDVDNSTYQYIANIADDSVELDIENIPEFKEIISELDKESDAAREPLYDDLGEYKPNPSNRKYYSDF